MVLTALSECRDADERIANASNAINVLTLASAADDILSRSAIVL